VCVVTLQQHTETGKVCVVTSLQFAETGKVRVVTLQQLMATGNIRFEVFQPLNSTLRSLKMHCKGLPFKTASAYKNLQKKALAFLAVSVYLGTFRVSELEVFVLNLFEEHNADAKTLKS